jgi:putative chitinase
LGNTVPGDGFKYRGRGLIQITGRANYAACGEALALDLINQPELLEQPKNACMSAAWFWAVNGLNTLADAGDNQNIGSVINTGRKGRVPNGATGRQAFYGKSAEGAGMSPAGLKTALAGVLGLLLLTAARSVEGAGLALR